jgi:hypothetical protein
MALSCQKRCQVPVRIASRMLRAVLCISQFSPYPVFALALGLGPRRAQHRPLCLLAAHELALEQLAARGLRRAEGGGRRAEGGGRRAEGGGRRAVGGGRRAEGGGQRALGAALAVSSTGPTGLVYWLDLPTYLPSYLPTCARQKAPKPMWAAKSNGCDRSGGR